MKTEAIWLPDPHFMMEHEASERDVRNEDKLELIHFDSGDYRQQTSVVNESSFQAEPALAPVCVRDPTPPNSGPRPSAMVGCVNTASRSAV